MKELVFRYRWKIFTRLDLDMAHPQRAKART